MHCYFCETGERPGGMRFGIRQAVGVCQGCGIGVCAEHGRRDQSGRLLCGICAGKPALAAAPRAATVHRRPLEI